MATTKIRWESLRAVRAGRTLYTVDRARALAAWREGKGDALVTHGEASVTPSDIDWRGFVVPPGRKGGSVPADAERGTVPLQVRVERDVPALLTQEAERRGTSKGALLGEIVRAACKP